MKVYLLRHGIAEDSSKNGNDNERQLTKEGISLCKNFGKVIRLLEVKPDIVFTSPLKRAVQTAEITASTCGAKDKIVMLKSLSPGGNHAKTIALLKRYKNRNVLIVGHMPDLSELASLLVSGDVSLDFYFRKNSLLVISVDNIGQKNAMARIEAFYHADDCMRLIKGKI